MVAAWFATEDESNSTDVEIVVLRVLFVRRLRTAQVFGLAGGGPVLVAVTPRVVRICATRLFLLAPRSATGMVAFAVSLRCCGISGSGLGKSGFSQAFAYIRL
jgi:hypothetical protein